MHKTCQHYRKKLYLKGVIIEKWPLGGFLFMPNQKVWHLGGQRGGDRCSQKKWHKREGGGGGAKEVRRQHSIFFCAQFFCLTQFSLVSISWDIRFIITTSIESIIFPTFCINHVWRWVYASVNTAINDFFYFLW